MLTACILCVLQTHDAKEESCSLLGHSDHVPKRQPHQIRQQRRMMLVRGVKDWSAKLQLNVCLTTAATKYSFLKNAPSKPERNCSSSLQITFVVSKLLSSDTKPRFPLILLAPCLLTLASGHVPWISYHQWAEQGCKHPSPGPCTAQLPGKRGGECSDTHKRGSKMFVGQEPNQSPAHCTEHINLTHTAFAYTPD